MMQLDKEKYLDRLEEPVLGNAPYITYKGKRISQDLLNSLLEFISIDLFTEKNSFKTILEIGAGSGRTAFTFIKLLDGIKYIIADIPPALFVSQQYLSEIFPEKKVFNFRPFTYFSEVENEFAAADIVFLTPDQLSHLKNKSIDLFLAIDCLHEMKPSIIQRYITEAQRLAGYFYIKCWQHAFVPIDGYIYPWGEYPIPPRWEKQFDLPCYIPSDFAHSLYRIR